jgi:alpha,alpha-trehalase
MKVDGEWKMRHRRVTNDHLVSDPAKPVNLADPDVAARWFRHGQRPRPAPLGRIESLIAHQQAPRLRSVKCLAAAVVSVLCFAYGPVGAQTVGPAFATPPSIAYGELYRDVELASIFPDSKTFPDMIPDAPPATILDEYRIAQVLPGFDLATFVRKHFTGPTPPGPTINPAPRGTRLLDYVMSLWPILQQDATSVPPYSTLQPLPYPYVVPGGRFREVYYWDSDFTMLGLEDDGQHQLALDLLEDFAFELDHYGIVPNGNRSYYLSRSQPPFFSLMVRLIGSTADNATEVNYLPRLQQAWDFWMEGADTLPPGEAYHNAVRLPDGTLLNRYWDVRDAPRDESYKEDVETAAASGRPPDLVYRNLRATAESGWDFSSRWLTDGKTLGTVRTLAILPVDLNCLLVHLEETLSEAYRTRGDAEQAAAYQRRAQSRAEAIRRLMWDARDGVFSDYLWQEGDFTGAVTAATLYPLFLRIATAGQTRVVAATVERKLLDVGGLATTLVESGQQWDSPNGWAPLQWIAVMGLRNYGFDRLAHEIATRWVRENIAGYRHYAKLVEKYNVTTRGGDEGGGGEYATQIGFGWTNGVLVALTSLYPDLKAEAARAVPR